MPVLFIVLSLGAAFAAAASTGAWIIPALFFGWLVWLQFGKDRK